MKPVIGIVSRPSILYDKFDVQVVEETYKNAIIECGGIPITILPSQKLSFQSIIPREAPRMTDLEKDDLNQVLNMCDGILIPGGLKTYEYDYYICEYAKKNNIPLLGICAGMQVMAYLENNIGNNKNKNDIHKTNINGYSHNVDIKKDSFLYEIIKKSNIRVNSYHSYHVVNGGNNVVSAQSSNDGIIEAIESRNNDFYLGVQWHPEKNINNDENSRKIFKCFITQAKKRKNK